jgi:hypothetical protein
MSLSEILLAELLDDLHTSKEGFVSEAAGSISASELNLISAKRLADRIRNIGWKASAFDGAGTEWPIDNLPENFAPFILSIVKPEFETLAILTNVGFASFLAKGDSALVWRVARLETPLATKGRLFLNWRATTTFTPDEKTKSPRLLVREYTETRLVPDDIRPWILKNINYLFESDTSKIWARSAIAATLCALADEIDTSVGQLKFKGPPRLALTLPQPNVDLYEQIHDEKFQSLQLAVGWVYENEREAEIRHIMFASELARSGGGELDAIKRIQNDCEGALEGAKIAYQMSISELGKDTLKALSDLKKAISEDVVKVADSTRQTITAVATALALGLGLIAARIATSAAPWLLTGIMSIVALYVAIIIYSGYDFINLQRKLRTDWQPRLYRFLPETEYKKMVADPARHAENTFFWCARIGSIIVLLLLGALIVLWLVDRPVSQLDHTHVVDIGPDEKHTTLSPEIFAADIAVFCRDDI